MYIGIIKIKKDTELSTFSTHLREVWETKQSKNIKYSRRPEFDTNKNQLLPKLHLFENTKLRLWNLAEELHTAYQIYVKNPNLYGDDWLAFNADKRVRNYPWTDFPFTSVEAQKLLGDNNITGLTKYDSEVKKLKHITDKLRYEHWTPISFFRDSFVIAKEENLNPSIEDFYDLLKNNYRVVWITKEEDAKLNIKNKTKRTINTYTELGIEISDKELWNDCYNK